MAEETVCKSSLYRVAGIEGSHFDPSTNYRVDGSVDQEDCMDFSIPRLKAGNKPPSINGCCDEEGGSECASGLCFNLENFGGLRPVSTDSDSRLTEILDAVCNAAIDTGDVHTLPVLNVSESRCNKSDNTACNCQPVDANDMCLQNCIPDGIINNLITNLNEMSINVGKSNQPHPICVGGEDAMAASLDDVCHDECCEHTGCEAVHNSEGRIAHKRCRHETVDSLGSAQEYSVAGCDIVFKDGIEYRAYGSERHLQEIIDLVSRDLSEPYSVYTYRYFINNWPNLCIRALDVDRCVGAIVCKLHIYQDTLIRGYIAMLAVDKEYRRRGIGTQLVLCAIKAMIEDDCDDVILETETDNQAALKLYENLGFIRDKRLHRYYLNGRDAFRLHLLLD